MFLSIATASRSGIVYCFSCKETESVAAELARHGVSAAAYHGQMAPAQRQRVHREWVNNKVKAVVATLAFGTSPPSASFFLLHFCWPFQNFVSFIFFFLFARFLSLRGTNSRGS